MARFNRRPLRPDPEHLGPRRYLPDPDKFERLKRALQYTNNESKNFVTDLIHKYEECGGWTIRQTEYVDIQLDKARENYRRLHGRGRGGVREPRVTPEALRSLNRMFDKAGEFVRPEIQLFHAKVRPSSRTKGELSLFDKAGAFIGSMRPDGEVMVRNGFDAQIFADALSALGENPVKAATLYAETTGECCLCGRELGERSWPMHGLCEGRYGLFTDQGE